MLIEVTAEHIRKGKPGNCYHCPIARALHDATKLDWSVGMWGCCVQNIRALGYIKLSKNVKEFLKAFDNGEPVQPFRFRIRQEILNAHQGTA